VTIEATDVVALRRWVRRTQSSHRERGATAGNVYFAVLFVAIVGGMLHTQLQKVFWPVTPNFSVLAGTSLVAAGTGLVFLAMRRLGPLGLPRPAASWLLTAPVSRRRLLLPSFWLAALLAATTGALIGVAVGGHVAVRGMPGGEIALLPVIGALVALVLLLAALAAQRGGLQARAADRLAGLLVAAGLAGLVADSAVHAPKLTRDVSPGTAGVVAAALAVVVLALVVVTVGRLAATPNDRILESAKTSGTVLDAAFGVEPTFIADMMERRYWAGRRLRSRPFASRLPVLVAQDLRLALRRPGRLVWTVGTAALPVLVAGAPKLVLGIVVLLGGMIAGGASTGTVRTDAANPMMLRALALSSRQAVLQRFWVPGVLAGVWYTVALSLLRALGHLPPGPWWALGIALAPVGAVAAVRRGRVGMVRNDLLPLDTPMGTVSPGPLVNLAIGPDALLLGAPVLVQFVQPTPLGWTLVLVQAVIGVTGARAYLAGTTARDRVELRTAGR
jgi:Family of unknown function (DUF6297)